LQQAFAQSAGHFLASAFFAQPAQVLSLAHAEQAAFLASAFLALHPHESHAKAAEPATNSATTAILIIFFMVVLLLGLVNQYGFMTTQV
jgi:hypothetical protein